MPCVTYGHFGTHCLGISFHPSWICFNQIGTNSHFLSWCWYQNMNGLTSWCALPPFIFFYHNFFCMKPRCLGMITGKNATNTHCVRVLFVPTPWVQMLRFRVDWMLCHSHITHTRSHHNCPCAHALYMFQTCWVIHTRYMPVHTTIDIAL